METSYSFTTECDPISVLGYEPIHVKQEYEEDYTSIEVNTESEIREGLFESVIKAENIKDEVEEINYSDFVTCDIGIEKSFTCNQCGKVFSSKVSLTRHVRIHTATLNCDQCNKSFSDKRGLDKHKLRHAGLKPFSCSQCEKSFADKSTYNRHLRVHTGEKPYTCPVCNKACSRQDDLSVHMKVHSSEKPYSCNECGVAFSRNNDLKNHIRIHTGEKPFSCDLCGKSFSRSGHAAKHKRNHCSMKNRVTNKSEEKLTHQIFLEQEKIKEEILDEPID